MKVVKLRSDFEKDLSKLLKNGFDFTELNAILEKLRNEEKLESKYKDHQTITTTFLRDLGNDLMLF